MKCIILILIIYCMIRPSISSMVGNMTEFYLHNIYRRSTSDISRLTNPNYYRPGFKSIYWLHIEKTSSWIYNFLLVWACPEASSQALHASQYYDPNEKSGIKKSLHHFFISRFSYFDDMNKRLKLIPVYDTSSQNMAAKSCVWNCSVTFDAFSSGFGFHLPFHVPEMNHSVITMIRNPIDRIISAFLFGVMVPTGSPYRLNGMNGIEVRRKVENSTIPIQAYVETPGIASCQTKMVLGYNCGSVKNLTESDLIEAKRRLRNDMYFIGITEESEASARLFLALHHMDGGRPTRITLEDFESSDPPFHFTSLRKSAKHTASTHMTLVKQLQEIGWRDYFDEQLHLEATSIFYELCRKYNIRTIFGDKF